MDSNATLMNIIQLLYGMKKADIKVIRLMLVKV